MCIEAFKQVLAWATDKRLWVRVITNTVLFKTVIPLRIKPF